MFENILSELTYSQKKEIGKYALVFTGGVITGFVLKKVLETSMDEINKKRDGDDILNQIDISDLDDEIVLDEDVVEDY